MGGRVLFPPRKSAYLSGGVGLTHAHLSLCGSCLFQNQPVYGHATATTQSLLERGVRVGGASAAGPGCGHLPWWGRALLGG